MSLLKSGQIVNCCHPNALITLKEYLQDYATEKTKKLGDEIIKKELEKITNTKVKDKASKFIDEIESGARDFRF